MMVPPVVVQYLYIFIVGYKLLYGAVLALTRNTDCVRKALTLGGQVIFILSFFCIFFSPPVFFRLIEGRQLPDE